MGKNRNGNVPELNDLQRFRNGYGQKGVKTGENGIRLQGREDPTNPDTERPLLEITPVTLREARAFVDQHHRHHRSPQGGIFAVAVSDQAGSVRGVAIVGRPVARNASDGWTAEVTRVATDGTRNACSMLYGAAWRAAKAMGYRRIITYTLKDEPGTSLRAAGWTVIGETKGGSWDRKTRPRIDTHPLQEKLCWTPDHGD